MWTTRPSAARSGRVSVSGEYTEPFARILFENLDALGIERADSYPRATHFVPQMVDLIAQLREKGLAYEVDGSVYFDISEFPDYGKLSQGGCIGRGQGRAGRRRRVREG
jgi:cysteinyl-tRNA synthetase